MVSLSRHLKKPIRMALSLIVLNIATSGAAFADSIESGHTSLLEDDALTASGGSNIAQTQWYEVNLLIFKDQSERWEPYEHWHSRRTALEPDLVNALPFEAMALNEQQPIDLLPEPTTALNEMINGIHRRKSFHILLAKSWRQPFNHPDQTTPYRIEVGEEVDGEHELSGTLTISVRRYLHFTADLRLKQFMAKERAIELGLHTPLTESEAFLQDYFSNAEESSAEALPYQRYGEPPTAHSVPSDPASVIESESTPYSTVVTALDPAYVTVRNVPLKQSRRMRSGEMHYLDHPLMGILVNIEKTDYQPSAPLDDTSNDSDHEQSKESDKILEAPWEQQNKSL